MDKKEFAAKFKDPRWQRVRLQVMERDQFMCRKCGDKDSTLNVHHCFYEWGNDPWDYPIPSLITLCEGCHEAETQYSADVKKNLWREFARHGVLTDEIHRIGMNFAYAVRYCKGNATMAAVVIADAMLNKDSWDRAVESAERSYAQDVFDDTDWWKHGLGGPIDYLLHKVPDGWDLEMDAQDRRNATQEPEPKED